MAKKNKIIFEHHPTTDFYHFLPFLPHQFDLENNTTKKTFQKMKQTTTATVLADNAANVPTTLVSYLQRLKSLDETSISVSDEVHSKVESFVLALTANKKRKSKSSNNNEVFDDDDDFDEEEEEEKKKKKKKKKLLEEEIDKSVKACVEIADEKCALAARAYDLVDEHITKLDKDLRVFEDEARNNTNSNKNKLSKQGGQNDKKQDQAGSPYYVNEADPNEPTYCYCKRVSFGEMVGCENDKCKIEWFHFACVGLDPTVKLKGKWYCKECKLKMKMKKK